MPNFSHKEDCITYLTTWIHIPKLSLEYFNKHFLLTKIRKKIGKVLTVDNTTANVERSSYRRLSVQVDLTKLLLSTLRLNGKVWKIVMPPFLNYEIILIWLFNTMLGSKVLTTRGVTTVLSQTRLYNNYRAFTFANPLKLKECEVSSM